MPHRPRRDALDAPQPSRPLQLTPVVSQSPLAHSRDFALSHSLRGSSSTLMSQRPQWPQWPQWTLMDPNGPSWTLMPRRAALDVLSALIALQIVPEPSSDLSPSHSLSPLIIHPRGDDKPSSPAGPLHAFSALYSRSNRAPEPSSSL